MITKKLKKKHLCEYCNKNFDRQQRLDNHLLKCSNKNYSLMKQIQIQQEKLNIQQENMSNQQEKINNKIYIQSERINNQHNIIENQQKEINKLKEKIENCTKINGNVCINQTFNITINAYKDTDYTIIKEDLIKCLDDKFTVPSFDKLIHNIHFNKNKPENHNIYKPNLREDKILTFDGEKFVIEKRNIVKELLEKLENIIDNTLDTSTDIKYRNKLKRHIKYKMEDFEYEQSTCKDIERELYNERNVVKNTHRNEKYSFII